MVFFSLLEKFYAVTHGTDGMRLAPLHLGGRPLSPDMQGWVTLAIAIALALGCGAFVRFYLASPMGHALIGIKTRETRLEFMGVPPRLILLFAYVMAAAMAGCGGAVLAMATGQVTPQLAYWTTSGELVFIAVLGGTANVFGAFLGAFAYEAHPRLRRRARRRCLADDPRRHPASRHPVRARRPARSRPHAAASSKGEPLSLLLSAKGLAIAFGGVKAADGIDLDVFDGEFSRHHRSERGRQDHLH